MIKSKKYMLRKGRHNMLGKLNLQDTFLNQTRKDKQVVTIFLVSGFQLKGIVRGFDNFVVLLDTDGKQQMIYKHAISTIVPSKTISFAPDSPEE